MDEKTIKKDLSEIRYYYANQKECDIAFKSVSSSLIEKINLYKDIINDAPLPVYLCFFNLYINGLTQEELADEMGVSRTVVYRAHRKMFNYILSKRLTLS